MQCYERKWRKQARTELNTLFKTVVEVIIGLYLTFVVLLAPVSEWQAQTICLHKLNRKSSMGSNYGRHLSTIIVISSQNGRD